MIEDYKHKRSLFLVLAVIIFVVAVLLDFSLQRRYATPRLIDNFTEQITKNRQMLADNLDNFSTKVELLESESRLFALFNENKEDKTGWLIYQNNQLKIWSDRALSFYNNIEEFETLQGWIKLPNGYYLIDHKQVGDFTVIGLRLIKTDFGYENIYLQNKFVQPYHLPSSFEITNEKTELINQHEVSDKNGNHLFYVNAANGKAINTIFPIIIAALYLLSLIFLLMWVRSTFTNSSLNFFIKSLLLVAFLLLFYFVRIHFNIPKTFSLIDAFQPNYFAYSKWLPSLGEFILLSIFIFFTFFCLSTELKIAATKKLSAKKSRLQILYRFIVLMLSYFSIYHLIRILLLNSTISFSLHKIIEVNLLSILSIAAVGLLLIGLTLFTVKLIATLKVNSSKTAILIGIIAGAVVILFVQYLFYKQIRFVLPLLFIANTAAALFLKHNLISRYKLSYIVFFISIASLFSLFLFYNTIAEKERGIQKLMAVNLVAEHDPTAEVFLSEIQNNIDNDTTIIEKIYNRELLEKYLIQQYFSGYFRKYNVAVFVCSNADSLIVNPDNQMTPCVPFFSRMIQEQGLKIENSNFYFMDNMNGRISYTGALDYLIDNTAYSVFIELNTDLLFNGIGFPELLIDQSLIRPQKYKNFTYAKYYGGALADRQGGYSYNLNVYAYVDTDKEFSYKKWDKKEHLIYHTRKDNFVIVSRNVFTFTDYLISFPYLFVFYFIIVLLLIFLDGSLISVKQIRFNLKLKIQAAIVSMVFVSLLIVAVGTIWYNVREYEIKHHNDLSDKMKSIAEEIDMRLNDKTTITPELVSWLYRELAKLSNIFRTDINIYGIDGNLIASSRSEIFERGLISRKINAKAYYEIYQNFKLDYFQPEKIGKLSYLSAYQPIINNNSKYLGFINLPYFIKQDRYSQELSTIIVAFINLYVLLLLVSIIVAVLLANQITKPLVVIQDNLKKIDLGKRNEHIQYSRQDEIGSLAKEYNKKVDELAVSADLLAKSERESAWREMAKQIAHEIKNPLTPMKLNLQNLQRLDSSEPRFNKQVDKVTTILIEQIDNLSNIATEFSNFAKIPLARKEVFNLAAKIRKIIDLYEIHSRAKITFNANGYENIMINADREQLTRAMINLIRNGIQAIPDNIVGLIEISLHKKENMALIKVKDNGIGIPKDIQQKMFSPNFTTKSSGMGLGLAIVKNIVDNFNGQIYFETEENNSTTFFVEIPIHIEKM